MTANSRVQTALRSAEPAEALRTLALEFAREGIAKAEIYNLFEGFLVQQRGQPEFSAQDEEAVLDLLDALTGDCHPAAQLLP